MTKGWIWLCHHWRQSIIVAGIVAAILLLWFGAGLLSSHWENKADLAWNKAMSMQAGSDTQVAALEKIASEYSRRSAGRRALLNLGKIFVNKDPVKARKYFTDLLAASNQRPILEVYALHGIAQTYIEENNWDEAAKEFLKAASLPSNKIADESRFQAALCFESAGKTEEARKLYEEIIKNPDSEAFEKAKGRIIWLDVSAKS